MSDLEHTEPEEDEGDEEVEDLDVPEGEAGDVSGGFLKWDGSESLTDKG